MKLSMYEKAMWYDRIEELSGKVALLAIEYKDIVNNAIYNYYNEKEYYGEIEPADVDSFSYYVYKECGNYEELMADLYMSVHGDEELQFNPEELWFKLRNLHRELCRLDHDIKHGHEPEFRPNMINRFKPYGYYK